MKTPRLDAVQKTMVRRLEAHYLERLALVEMRRFMPRADRERVEAYLVARARRAS